MYQIQFFESFMTPDIGLMNRKIKTEDEAMSIAKSGIIKKYKIEIKQIETLETKYDNNSEDWYVALGWGDKRVIIKMDSVLTIITNIKMA